MRSAVPRCGRTATGTATAIVVPVVPVYANTRPERTPVPDHRPDDARPPWWGPLLVAVLVAVCALVVWWLLVGAMHEPIADPSRGVVTIPAPGPDGGVR